MDNGCLTPPLSPWQAGTNQLRNYIICSGDTRGVAGTKWRSSLASRERIAHLDLAAWLQDRARTVSGRDQRENAREFGQMADHLGGRGCLWAANHWEKAWRKLGWHGGLARPTRVAMFLLGIGSRSWLVLPGWEDSAMETGGGARPILEMREPLFT